MNPEQLAGFREQLLALQQGLAERARTSQDATATVKLDQQSVGRLSRMDAMQAQQMAQATEQRRQLQAQKVTGALRRMDAGDYGRCHVCAEDIDPRRLHADPTITRCLGCMA